MSPRLSARSCCLLLLLYLGACRVAGAPAEPSATARAPADTPAAVAQGTAPPALTATTTASATNTATPAPSATATVTATELPPLRIAVPSGWRLEATAAASALAGPPGWQVVVDDDPRRLFESRQVDAALLPDDAGIPAGQLPLALAVPFSSDWDEATWDEALAIQNEGHPFVTVLSWHELAPRQRPLRVAGKHIADVDYPLQQPWSIHTAAEWQAAGAAFAGALQQLARPGDSRLAAVGDIMLDRALGDAVTAGDIAFPFARVADLLQEADYTVGNLESALGDTGEAAAKSYTFRAPPAAAQSLAWAGFDLVSLANNHALDFGPAALLQGISLLAKEGIATVGAGAGDEEARRPHVTEINGIRFAFLGYVHVPVEGRAPYFDTASWRAIPGVPGLAWADPDHVAADVATIRNAVDVVVVILHSGYEYVPSPSPEQAAAARAAVDAGASLVIGHHAHILQGVEFRASGAIVYGLGNFAFNITGPPQTVILNAWFDEQGLRQLAFQPAIIQGSGQPAPVTGAEAAAIRRQIYGLSGSFD